jgi:hypothetical protein
LAPGDFLFGGLGDEVLFDAGRRRYRARHLIYGCASAEGRAGTVSLGLLSFALLGVDVKH